MKKIFKAILLILIFSRLAFSQSPPFKQFKTSDGLPSPDVYDCIQDHEGYMWFATENGVSRFDSYSFQNFSRKDGLNSNFILSVIENEKEILIGTQSDGINVHSDNKITSLSYNENPRLWINKLVLHKGKIYKFNYFNISMVDGDSSIIICSHSILPFLNIPFFKIFCLYSSNGRLLVATSDGMYEIKGTQMEKLLLYGIENSFIYCIASDENKNIYLSGDNIIYKISGDKVIDTYKFNFTTDQKIYRMLVDQKNYIWFYVMGEGLFRYNLSNNHLTDLDKIVNAAKLHVNDFYKDKKNNVWVNTYGKGIYCFYNTFINNYGTKDGLTNSKINSISGDKDHRIYCGTFNGLSILESDNFINIKTQGPIVLTDYIRSIYKTNDSLFVLNFATEKIDYYFINHKNVKLLYSPLRASIFIDDDTLISGAWRNELIMSTPFTNNNPYSDSNYIYAQGDSLAKNKINGLAKGKDGKIWIASDLGVSLLQNKKVKIIESNKLSSQFDYIKEDKNGFAWACGEKGLFIIKDTSVVYEFPKDHEKVSSFEFDNEGHAWVSTPKGLYGMSVYYDKDSINLKEEYLLNEKAGLVSNDISSLYYDITSNLLWAGTSDGLTSIDLNSFEKQLKDSLRVEILSINTSDSVYNMNEHISFPYYTNDIRIEVSSFDLNSTGNLQYLYKLKNEDTAWNITKENVMRFPSLQYGDYDFQVYAENNFGKVSDTSTVSFKVETPFTRSYFFYAIVALSVMGLTGFAVSRSSKKKYIIEKERNTFKNQISDLKQRSLVSMMNPHFVFNSLNSIQSFYNYKENESANEYLAKFSRLIRMNLDFADKTFIKLSDELERLESYLTLEKMRFDEDLKYEIWVSDDIDPEKTDIPNMIIQPFVENAIWHGILKSQNAGKVTVNIFHSQLPEEIRKNYQVQIHSALKGSKPDSIDPNPVHCIKIEIIDNGIGIKNCQKNKASDHISRGISVIKERLSILHHYAGETELVKITDRSELPDPASGTIVEIYLTPNICKVNGAE